MDIFQGNVTEHLSNVQWKNLKLMFETRWVENYEALIRFAESYKVIFETPENLELDSNSNVFSTALQLSKSITGSSFIINLDQRQHHILLTYKLTLYKNLQGPKCDLNEDLDLVDDILKTIKRIRNEIDSEFTKIFIKANSLLSLVGEIIKMHPAALRYKTLN